MSAFEGLGRVRGRQLSRGNHQRRQVVHREGRNAGLQLPLHQRLRDHDGAELLQVPERDECPARVGEQQGEPALLPRGGEARHQGRDQGQAGQASGRGQNRGGGHRQADLHHREGRVLEAARPRRL